jgi:hypothetical protein
MSVLKSFSRCLVLALAAWVELLMLPLPALPFLLLLALWFATGRV